MVAQLQFSCGRQGNGRLLLKRGDSTSHWVKNILHTLIKDMIRLTVADLFGIIKG